MSSIHPVRTSPVAHHMKKTLARAARSAPVSKIALKTGKTKRVKSEEELVETFNDDDDDDDDMGSGFLQFCAMCEKQIVIPNNSILYCSEHCRRMDAHIHDNDPSLSLLFGLPTSPVYDTDDSLRFKTRMILPPKLPTPRPLPTRIPPIAHNGKADLDPTEWKPAEGGSGKEKPGGQGKLSAWKPKLSHRPSSDAHNYLSQFHRSSPASTRRPGNPLRSTPSLSHTPTTTSSSEGSLAGTPTEVCDESLIHRAGNAHPNSGGSKGIELVVPKPASTIKTAQLDSVKVDGSDNTLVEDISYDKKWVIGSKGTVAGSLKKLLAHDDMDCKTVAM